MSPDSAMSPTASLNSGIDLDELDPAIRPQDDLFRHVNGKWIERTEIPSDKARYGSFYVLAEEAEKAVRDIIVEAQERRARHRGAQGRRPLRELPGRGAHREARRRRRSPPTSRAVDAVDSHRRALLAALGRLERARRQRLLPALRRQRPGQPRALPRLPRAGRHSACPTSRTTARRSSPTIRTAYLAYLERMFALAGFDDAAERAARVFALETDDRRAPLGQRAHPRQRGDLQPDALGRGRDALAGTAPTSTAGSTALDVPDGVVRRGRRAPAELRRGARRAVDGRPPRRLDGLAALAGHPLVARRT